MKIHKNEKLKMKNLKTFKKFTESVGELEDSFVDINIDETELETSDRPNLGKLKQKPGIEIIETPSKTDAYNAKMRKGGTIIQPKGFSDKQIHHVKDIKEGRLNKETDWEKWKTWTKKERIKYLIDSGCDKKEAYEIYSENPHGLPTEIKALMK